MIMTIMMMMIMMMIMLMTDDDDNDNDDSNLHTKRGYRVYQQPHREFRCPCFYRTPNGSNIVFLTRKMNN